MPIISHPSNGVAPVPTLPLVRESPDVLCFLLKLF